MEEEDFHERRSPAASESRLTGGMLLEAWERGAGEPPLARARTLLRAACPGRDAEDAAALPLTQRDHALVALHARSFGPAFSAVATCESCGERLEFILPAQQVAGVLQAADVDCTVERDSIRLRLRLANTSDLAAVAALPDAEAARWLLLARCAEAVDGDGRSVPLPESLRETALERLDALHEAAEVALALGCPACDARQAVHLDVGAFLWAEVRNAAQRLLDEIHELAWAYGWSESAILKMGAARRQAYLERARG
ncbi:MAG TPA: hypothetical protein VET89_14460 [Stellaceae bacterium]|nr:hypothetical protein [Stellaceae bacterium]